MLRLSETSLLSFLLFYVHYQHYEIQMASHRLKTQKKKTFENLSFFSTDILSVFPHNLHICRASRWSLFCKTIFIEDVLIANK